MGRLSTSYLGLELRSPLVASASPLTGRLESARRMEQCGAAAIVLPSLFEEEIIHEDSDLVLALEAGSEHFAEALSYFPNLDSYPSTAEYYLALIHDAKQVPAGSCDREPQRHLERRLDALREVDRGGRCRRP